MMEISLLVSPPLKFSQKIWRLTLSWAISGASNGNVPTTRTYRIHPSDQQSSSGPMYSRPSNTSGAAYGGLWKNNLSISGSIKNIYLPHQVLSIESVEKYCPKPKSASFTFPFSSKRTFSVFKSLLIEWQNELFKNSCKTMNWSDNCEFRKMIQFPVNNIVSVGMFNCT